MQRAALEGHDVAQMNGTLLTDWVQALPWALTVGLLAMLAVRALFLLSIAVCRPRPAAPGSPLDPEAQRAEHCGHCGRINPPDSLTCLHCGMRLRAPHGVG